MYFSREFHWEGSVYVFFNKCLLGIWCPHMFQGIPAMNGLHSFQGTLDNN